MKDNKVSRTEIESFFKTLQDQICKEISQADGSGAFKEDLWQHHAGGGGRTRLIQDSELLEKAGVNFSAVEGTVTEAMQKQLKIENEANFFATGVSIVMHPKSPMLPIIHMNVRYFELSDGTYWFGGGIDLTPHYIDEKQAKWFHQELKKVCDKHDLSFYETFKKQADDYFYLPHRKETRGVGGIFFDHLNEKSLNKTKQEIFAFVKEVGRAFAPSYSHLMKINADKSFTEEETKWQMLRRGRYVEFNLVWDRGTKFGLATGGRTESILMSLPAQANWTYDYTAKKGSNEEKTLDLLKKGVDWVGV